MVAVCVELFELNNLSYMHHILTIILALWVIWAFIHHQFLLILPSALCFTQLLESNGSCLVHPRRSAACRPFWVISGCRSRISLTWVILSCTFLLIFFFLFFLTLFDLFILLVERAYLHRLCFFCWWHLLILLQCPTQHRMQHRRGRSRWIMRPYIIFRILPDSSHLLELEKSPGIFREVLAFYRQIISLYRIINGR